MPFEELVNGDLLVRIPQERLVSPNVHYEAGEYQDLLTSRTGLLSEVSPPATPHNARAAEHPQTAEDMWL